ncbi:MAG: tetratricopeptide repeat protein, partial [Planctomycetota bacterium]
AFENLSDDGETAYFARGFTEDLIGCLTRFRVLRVIATESSFRLETAGRSLAETPREWGLDAILEGSVRRGGDQIRVTARLVAVGDGRTVWSETFDAPLGDVFSIQDQIAGAVAGTLVVGVEQLRLERGRRDEPLEAYDLWLRGMECLGRATLEGDEESREYFRRALEIDGGYARCYAGLSLSHFNEWSCQAWHLWDESEENAFEFARRAVELDDSDALVHAVLARMCRHRGEHDIADAHAERALELNSNDFSVLIQVAIATLFGGRHAEARELARRAMSYNPMHAMWCHGIVGWTYFMEGRYDEALVDLSRGGDAITNFGAYRAACHVALGDQERAREEYGRFERQYCEKIAFGREPEPGEALRWAIGVEPFRELADSERVAGLLRSAGLADVDVGEARDSRPRAMVRAADIEVSSENVFASEGELWTLEYEGRGARLVGVKGFHDIARLLSEPGVSIHSLELSGAPRETEEAQPVLDARARREYRQRVEEAQGQLERAERDNDLGRGAALREELDAIVEELMRATGLSRRTRAFGGRGERARSAVTWRIRSAIKKISAAHPRLGQHLANSVKTGIFCVYEPEKAVEWRL